jgi:geranylgeranyl diphosphate synthase, type III
MDLFWRDTLTCPTESDYLEMVSNKTGGLFRLAIKLMEAESTTLNPSSQQHDTTAGASSSPISAPESSADAARATNTCVPLINTIGLFFQILDDHLNLHSPAYASRKGHAEDLTEGKFSFPIIHAIRSDPSNLVLLNILRQKPTDPEVKRYAIEYMERKGSFEYTKRVIANLEKKAIREVERLESMFGASGKHGAESIKGILGKLKAL